MADALESTNGDALSAGDLGELRTLEGQLKSLHTSILVARTTWARQHGLTFNGARDEYAIFGYDDVISTEQYRAAYERGGLAGRIIDVMPDATWRGNPAMELVEDEDPQKETAFEKAWYELERKHQICAKLQRVDKLSRLSTYAVLLIGASGDLSQPLPRGNPDRLLYLAPFMGGGGPGGHSNAARHAVYGADASVFEYETNSACTRFGLPTSYTLKRTDIASPALARPVHWTRVVHVAEGLLDDEVFGQPALARVWNLLQDLRKVTGGGAESFWLRANQGLHLDIDKDMALPDVAGTVEALKAQAEEYKHQITRWLRTRGVDVQTLGSDVANFAPPADAIITQIAGAKGIPKRILTGSEMGELASSQDRENFRDIVIGRQEQYAGPYIARALADRLIEYAYLPTPLKGASEYMVKWPHIQVLTEQEKVTGAQGWASVNQTQGEVVFTDAEIRDKWAGYEPLTDEQRAEITDRKEEEALRKQDVDVEGVKKMQEVAPPEDTAASPFAKKKLKAAAGLPEDALRAAESGSFASTQVQLPLALANAVRSFGTSIPAFDLCDEEGGLEEDLHITVKYGLHTQNAADVRKALATVVGPLRFTLGPTNVFRTPEYDVLYVEVTSPDLVALNAHISSRLDHTTTHPVYRPHVTVAYLKPGLGVRYAGKNAVAGLSAAVGLVRFSPVVGYDTDLRITGRDSTSGSFALASPPPLPTASPAPTFVTAEGLGVDPSLLKLLEAAILSNNTDVIDAILGIRRDAEGVMRGLHAEHDQQSHGHREGGGGGSASPSVPKTILDTIRQPDGGFTYHPATGSSPTEGYAVSLHRDRERIINAKDATVDTLAQYAKDNWDLLKQHGNYLGGWHDPATGAGFLDVVTVLPSLDEALTKGALAQQIAVFDLKGGKSIDTTYGKQGRIDRAAEIYALRNSSPHGEALIEPDWPDGRRSLARGSDRAGAENDRPGAHPSGDRESARDSRDSAVDRDHGRDGALYPRIRQFVTHLVNRALVFDKDQPRDEDGKWSDTGASGMKGRTPKEPSVPTVRPADIPHEEIPNRPFEASLRPAKVSAAFHATPKTVKGGFTIGGGHINPAWKVTTPEGEAYLFKPIEGERTDAREDQMDPANGASLAEREVLAAEIGRALGLSETLVPSARMGIPAALPEPPAPPPQFPTAPVGQVDWYERENFDLQPPPSRTPAPEHSGVIATTIGGLNASQGYDAWGRPVWRFRRNELVEPSARTPSSSPSPSASNYGDGSFQEDDDGEPRSSTDVRDVVGQRGAMIDWKQGRAGYDQYNDGSVEDRASLSIFDTIIGNTDRHSGNYMMSNDDDLIGIDHGYAFPDTDLTDDEVGGSLRSFIMAGMTREPSKDWATDMARRVASVDWPKLLEVSPLNTGEQRGVLTRVRIVKQALKTSSPLRAIKDQIRWHY